MRASPWFGSERTQWLKAVVYDAYDHWLRLRTRVAADEADEIAEELEGVLSVNDPVTEAAPLAIGWPPAPLKTLLHPAIEHEGVWTSAHPDLVALRNPEAPYPFVFTFLRTDPERTYSQISITLWDPRQVSLHVVAGTQEPKSATGEVGSGLIPRDPAVLGRVVGAFNGAFQAVHGDFGMMERDTVVLPPKPFAATVVELRDGTAGFGTWPDSPTIPEEFLSFRQNMTALVQDERENPYRRHWWGGLPEGWTEESRTVRSGLCLTREGFIAYFYGNHADPKQLARAMLATRCSFGIHLDMNAGHTGFEFYRVERSPRPLTNRRLDELWEATGAVPDAPGWQFLTRLMVRKMPLMNFPRYLSRVSRDFFYLKLRTILPGPPIEPLVEGADANDGVWTMNDVAQHGWPAAVAKTTLRLDARNDEVRARVPFAEPGETDAHGRQPRLNCARKRRSFSKNMRRSFTA
jgi:hypothetical protein